MPGASFIIQTITNNLDGLTANVLLSGVPSGSVTFKVSRTNDYSKAALVPFVGSGNAFVVSFDAPVLWWVWGVDSHGTTPPVPVWIGLSDDVDLNLFALKGRDILRLNKAAIEVKMQAINPGETIKQIEYGSPAGITDYPSILFVRPKLDDKYAFFTFGSELSYTIEIFCMVIHQDKLSAVNLASAMTSAVMSILRQPDYTTLTLDSGLPLNVNISQASTDEEQYEENKWAASGSLVMVGDGLTQDGSLTWP